jgi:hypothetical protein
MVGVLHTWTRDLQFLHPHVHYIVPGGGLSQDGQWRSSRNDFLVHEKPLAIIFRAKIRDELKKARLFHLVDKRVWKKDWVVDSKPVGSGLSAFKYLAPYIFRVAIGNNRILSLKDGLVTFQYKESATDQIKTSRIPAQEFIRRFLQNVLPKHFTKVRYYGLLSPSNRRLLDKARLLLAQPLVETTVQPSTGSAAASSQLDVSAAAASSQRDQVLFDQVQTQAPLCPDCGSQMSFVARLSPVVQRPP